MWRLIFILPFVIQVLVFVLLRKKRIFHFQAAPWIEPIGVFIFYTFLGIASLYALTSLHEMMYGRFGPAALAFIVPIMATPLVAGVLSIVSVSSYIKVELDRLIGLLIVILIVGIPLSMLIVSFIWKHGNVWHYFGSLGLPILVAIILLRKKKPS